MHADTHPDAEAFFLDYWRETHGNGFDWRLGRYVPTHYPDNTKGALLILKPMTKEWSKTYGHRGVAYVEWVQALNLNYKKSAPHLGEGTRTMKWVCALADAHNVVLKLTAGNSGERGFKTLPVRTLITYYKRFGFEVEGHKGSNHMVRVPRGLHLVR
jgi:hypothetical protein